MISDYFCCSEREQSSDFAPWFHTAVNYTHEHLPSRRNAQHPCSHECRGRCPKPGKHFPCWWGCGHQVLLQFPQRSETGHKTRWEFLCRGPIDAAPSNPTLCSSRLENTSRKTIRLSHRIFTTWSQSFWNTFFLIFSYQNPSASIHLLLISIFQSRVLLRKGLSSLLLLLVLP